MGDLPIPANGWNASARAWHGPDHPSHAAVAENGSDLEVIVANQARLPRCRFPKEIRQVIVVSGGGICS